MILFKWDLKHSALFTCMTASYNYNSILIFFLNIFPRGQHRFQISFPQSLNDFIPIIGIFNGLIHGFWQLTFKIVLIMHLWNN